MKAVRIHTPGGPEVLRFDDVPVLTDDYAPTDALLID